MKNRFRFNRVLVSSIFALLSVTQAHAASNFTISPTTGYPFPTQVNTGEMVSVYYTVLNNTHSARIGYTLQGLPNEVKQNTNINNSCSNPVSLPAKGSCILRLDITQTVQTNFALCKGASCTKATTPINVLSTNSSTEARETLVGYYTTTTNNNVALAFTSTDQGLSWSLSPALPIPSTSMTPTNISPINLSCDATTGLKCTMVGTYINSLQAAVPLSYYSIDGGVNWILSSTLPLPVDALTSNESQTGITSISCDIATGTTCVATGGYKTTSGSILPLAYTSSNGGQTWALSATHPLPIDALTGATQQAFAGAVACDAQTINCVSVGSYTNNLSTKTALAFSSSNGGRNWVISSSPLPLPSDGLNIEYGFVPATCNYTGQVCQYVFSYTTVYGANSLVYITQDGGNTWSYSVPYGLTTTNPDVELAAGVSCDKASGLNCVTAGIYEETNGGFFPIIYTSTNGGLSWTQSTAIPIPVDAVTGPTAYIGPGGGVTCDIYDAKSCTAIGSYANTSGLYLPLIYNTTDNGQTWTLGATLPLPSGANNVNLVSVK